MLSLRQEIRSVSADLDAPNLLRHLVEERFPGEIVVTASLMAPSIVVLKMIADVNPATPVVFCQRPPIFEESAEYRALIVEKLGLTNTALNDGRETEVRQGDRDHTERMWVNYRDMPGRSSHLLHLNDTIAQYKCWVSAVYHVPPAESVKNRVDVDGRIIQIHPLLRWDKKRIHKFMSDHDLPYHKMAKRTFTYDDDPGHGTYPMYHF